MPQPSLLYLDARNIEHVPLIVNGLNMGNNWDSEELAADYLETGICNLRRWSAEVVLLQGSEEPLAMAAWRAITNPELIGFAGIAYVHTTKEHRKQGYGAIVVHAAEDRAREQGFQHVGLSSVKSAIRFYEAIGYRSSNDETRGNGYPWMTKDLTS